MFTRCWGEGGKLILPINKTQTALYYVGDRDPLLLLLIREEEEEGFLCTKTNRV
tara:strand:- start:153 stop:314 length:162 start_codon:yes stop_codon:yes gene_type:complete